MRHDWLRRPWLANVAGAIVLGAFVVLLAAHKRPCHPDVPRGDVIYDVVVARSLAEGHGLSTTLLPLGAFDSLLGSGRAAVDPWPSFHKFLLPQVILAPVVAVLGATVDAARLVSLAEYTALVLTLFGVLSYTLRSVPQALGFALAFVSFDELNALALSGLGACGDALFFFLALVAWAWIPGRPKLAALAGALLALTVLERYSFALLVPFYLVGVWLSAGRAAATRAALGAATVLGPVITWSFLKYGSAFPSPQGVQLLLFGTKYFPTDTWYTAGWPHLGLSMDDLPRELWHKAGASARTLAQIVLATPVLAVRNIAVAGAAVLGAAQVWRDNRSLRPVLVLATLFTCAYLGAHLLIGFSYRYVIFVFPGAWVLACIYVRHASRLAARVVGRTSPVLWGPVCVGLVILPELARFHAGEVWCRDVVHTCPIDRYCDHDEIEGFLRAAYPVSGLVIAGGNRPWELALDTHSRIVPLPKRPEELARFERSGVAFDLLLLPADLSFVGDGARPADWAIWDAVRDARLPVVEGLALRHAFSDGSLLYGRMPGVPNGVDYCALRSSVDAGHEGDRKYLGPNFRFTERHGDLAWSWVDGLHAEITLVSCSSARRLRVKLLAAAAPAEVAIAINGRPAGVAHMVWPMGWEDAAFDLSEGSVVDGANLVTFDVSAERPATPMLAFARASLARE